MKPASWLWHGVFISGMAGAVALVGISLWWLHEDMNVHDAGLNGEDTSVSSIVSTPTDASGSSVQTASQDIFARLADRHLMGKERQEVTQPAPSPPPVTAPAPAPSVEYRLPGIMQATSHPAALLQADGKTGVYRPGDTLPDGAVLRSIHSDRVIIERQTGGTETLMLLRRTERVTRVPLPQG